MAQATTVTEALVFAPSQVQVPLRARVLLLTLFLIPLNAYWVGWMEAVKWTGHPTTYSLYFNAVLILLALFVVTGLIRWLTGWQLLCREEMIALYFAVGVGSALVGHDQSQVLLAVIGHTHYFKDPFNRYEEILFPHLPSWLIVTDTSALRDLYIGNSSLWLPQNLFAWLGPLSYWWAFWLALLVLFLSLSVLFLPQWVRNEKLSFPLARFAYYFTDPNLLKDKRLWYGAIGPIFVNCLNNLHAVVSPAFPQLHTHRIDLGPYITSRPWNALGWTPINFFPFAIGIGFLLPVDILLSSWLFYIFWKAQRVIVAAFGYPTGGMGNPPYPHEQSFGAYLGLAFLILWSARHHLFTGWRGKDRERANGRYKIIAVMVFTLSFLFLIGFSIKAGMQPWAAVLFFLGYTGVSLTVARLRGEFGAPVHDLHFANPGSVFLRLVGNRWFTPQTLTVFALYHWFNRAHRSHPMPTAMEGLYIGQQTNAETTFFVLIALAILIGIPSSCLLLLEPYYRLGAATSQVGGAQRWFGWEAYNQYLIPWLTETWRPNYGAIAFTAGGFLFVWLLHLVRIYWIGFPLHPVGYAVSGTWSMEMVWFPLFLAWVAKALVIRYGTYQDYHRVSRFFIGLVLGDFVSGGLWNVYGTIAGKEVYRFNE
ncbi:MAG: hypothetical protein NZ959_00715 [Armatimonadetes bacterium]|nr:hypothetical protein [Armatimonadota bacterium]MDW8121090.1 DUF6785 family protein [Armatimonadota bacterium]